MVARRQVLLPSTLVPSMNFDAPSPDVYESPSAITRTTFGWSDRHAVLMSLTNGPLLSDEASRSVTTHTAVTPTTASRT